MRMFFIVRRPRYAPNDTPAQNIVKHARCYRTLSPSGIRYRPTSRVRRGIRTPTRSNLRTQLHRRCHNYSGLVKDQIQQARSNANRQQTADSQPQVRKYQLVSLQVVRGQFRETKSNCGEN